MMPKCAKRFTGHGLVVRCPYWSIIWIVCVCTPTLLVPQYSWTMSLYAAKLQLLGDIYF